MSVVPTLIDFSPAYAESLARRGALQAGRDRVAAKAQELRQADINGPGQDAKASRMERAAKILAGESPSPAQPVTIALAAALSELADHDAACELYDREHEKLRRAEAKRLRQSLQGTYDVAAKRFASALLEMHSALCSMWRLKRGLSGQGLGIDPPCRLDTEFLGNPFEKTGDLAILLRECVAHKYLNKVPQEVR